MKCSDLYFGLATLFLACEVSMSYESGWMIGLGFLLVIATYHEFNEGASSF